MTLLFRIRLPSLQPRTAQRSWQETALVVLGLSHVVFVSHTWICLTVVNTLSATQSTRRTSLAPFCKMGHGSSGRNQNTLIRPLSQVSALLALVSSTILPCSMLTPVDLSSRSSSLLPGRYLCCPRHCLHSSRLTDRG